MLKSIQSIAIEMQKLLENDNGTLYGGYMSITHNKNTPSDIESNADCHNGNCHGDNSTQCQNLNCGTAKACFPNA